MATTFAIPIPIPSTFDGFRAMTTPQHEDSILAQQITDGDETALEEVYRLHGGAVKALARRILRDDALAEDVVQDVFVSFWNGSHKYDPDRGSIRTYLITIAHRRAVDIVRSEEARSAREEKAPAADPPVDLENEVWIRAQSEQVRNAVAGLNPVERDAISLAYFGGLSYVEVARTLGQPEGTIKSRIRSGMRKLSDELGSVAP